MKNIPIKYAIVIVVIILILLGIIIWQTQNRGAVSEMSPATTIVQQSTPTPSQNPVMSTVTSPVSVVKTPSKVVPAPAPGQSYVDYMTQLTNNLNKCASLAQSQYKQLYPNLIGSSFTNSFNPTNNMCYSRIIGKAQLAYATSTTGHIYFRNATNNSLLAECTDPTGTMYADSNWVCTNHVTGKVISKAEFDATVSTDITQ